MGIPVLSDGIVELSAFVLDDVGAHLDGEDDESVHWLTEGQPSTMASTSAWVERNLASWRSEGPTRMLAVRDSYLVQSWARRRGYATRAVALMCSFLRGVEGVEAVVLRVDPENVASLQVAIKAGFEDVGRVVTPDGDRVRRLVRRIDVGDG